MPSIFTGNGLIHSHPDANLLQLGDPERRAASSAAYLLTGLLSTHPNMKVYAFVPLKRCDCVIVLNYSIKIVNYVLSYFSDKTLKKLKSCVLFDILKFADCCDR